MLLMLSVIVDLTDAVIAICDAMPLTQLLRQAATCGPYGLHLY